MSKKIETKIDELTFYSAFQILHSYYDVMSYKGKIYDVFGYQYLGMIYLHNTGADPIMRP